MRVTLAGLTSASRNGDVGTVASYNAWKARYAVKMEGDAGMMAISPGNLLQHPVVTLWELSLREMNGEAGTIVSLDEGTIARTFGLKAENYNGRWVTVGRHDEGFGKGELMTSNAETVKVKLENVIV
ncbi:hypothetical protein TrLO_g15485 [Triparma laevis f. longispina]|uniref:Uncharacterized protein n=1 Tax=Triparma laevis f. longispina TaxID=1714387 RepID=A0A9W7KU84_9STRA|nr:hypothetical protein TrLO_g15485 [Triparma laevis f. longispina]